MTKKPEAFNEEREQAAFEVWFALQEPPREDERREGSFSLKQKAVYWQVWQISAKLSR